jgi:predicted nucleic acid-binding OB-fold protein
MEAKTTKIHEVDKISKVGEKTVQGILSTEKSRERNL